MSDHALSVIAKKFNSIGVSIWINVDGRIHCVANWNGNHQINQKVSQLFERTERVLENEADLFIKMDQYIVVLHGQINIDSTDAIQFFNEWHPWIHILIELEKKKLREKSLNLLMDVAHTIASSLQSEDILNVIIESAVKTIPHADTGFLFLYDKKIKKLLVKSAVGFKKESYMKTRLVPGEGVSGRVFSTGQSLLINGEREISEAMANMSTQNFNHYVNSTIYREFPYSLISAPLIYKEEIIGVLTIDSFTKGARFVNEDLKILEALADHVAVAIIQADLFQKERSYREELQLTHVALRHEHELLQRTTDLHNRLTNIAAQGEGIEAIVQTLYSMVEVPFAVYDNLLLPVYVSPEIDSKRPPSNFFKYPSIKKMLSTKKWQMLELGDSEKLIVFPIVGAEHILGFLIIWAESDEILEGNSVLFEYGATVLALEWTKQEAIREAQERIKGEFFEEILSGEMNVQLSEQARNLGLKIDDYYAVILCQRDPGKSQSDDASFLIGMERQRWINHLESILAGHHLTGLVFQRGMNVVTIITFSTDNTKSEGRKMIRELIPQLERMPEKVQIGIGRVHKGLLNFNKSYKEAEQCLQLLNSSMEKKVLSYADMGVFRFFLQHDREELRFFLMDILGPLIIYDQNKKSTLLDTLILYVKFDRELNKLTSELNIHYNTLYYRINRIQDILGISFDQHADWLNIQLACQVYEYLEGIQDNK